MDNETDVLENRFYKSLTEVTQQPTQITIIASKINAGMEAFEKRKAELLDLKSQCTDLKIQSVDDRAGILQVVTMRKKLKSARVEIKKEGKSMRDPLTSINISISDKQKELVDIIEPTEKELQKKEDWVEEQKELVRLEVERQEQSRLQERVDKLSAYGYRVDLVLLKSLTDAQFEATLESAKVEHAKELALQAEQKKLANEDAERLKAERLELETLRKKAADAQSTIDKENARIKKEQEEKEAAMRAAQQKIDDEKQAIELQKQKEENDRLAAIKLEELRKEEAEKARLKLIADAEQAKILEAEKLAQSSDKVKFKKIADALDMVMGSMPDMKSRKAKALSIEVKGDVQKIIDKLIQGI